MQIEFRQRFARGHDVRRPGQRAHQLVQWPLHFQNDARAARDDARHVAAELDRVAKALLGME